jgi:hypothetical protein
MSPEDALAFAVRDRDVVRIRVPGERSLIFGDVVVRVHADFRLDMHIDTDEANAAELGADAVGYLDSIQQRASAGVVRHLASAAMLGAEVLRGSRTLVLRCGPSDRGAFTPPRDPAARSCTVGCAVGHHRRRGRVPPLARRVS